MEDLSPWVLNLMSAGGGLFVGVLSTLSSIKTSARSAQAVEYGALVKRLSEIESRADLMAETIFRKDRDLITALEDLTEAKAAAERADARAESAELRVGELEDRYNRLEDAFDELLRRTRMPASERDRLRTLYRSSTLVFATKESVNSNA